MTTTMLFRKARSSNWGEIEGQYWCGICCLGGESQVLLKGGRPSDSLTGSEVCFDGDVGGVVSYLPKGYVGR